MSNTNVGPAITRTQTAMCKHCGETIVMDLTRSTGWTHAAGTQQGKHTCGIEPYGFHAEPPWEPCGTHPANPCNGAR